MGSRSDDKFFDLDSTVRGEYAIDVNTIIVPNTVFEAFQNTKSHNDYYVAHELGHAKSAQTNGRREFIRRLTTLTGAAAASFIVSDGMQTALEGFESKDKADDLSWPERWTSRVAGGAAAFVTLKKIRQLWNRQEEFLADQFATEIYPRTEVIQDLTTSMEQRLITDGHQEKLTETKQYFQLCLQLMKTTDNIDMTPEKAAALWSQFLVEKTTEKISLKSIIKTNCYPGLDERIKRLLNGDVEEIQQGRA